jgi:hypothetical protein
MIMTRAARALSQDRRRRAGRAIRAQFKPQDLVFVVVGDAKLVKPQLAKVGLPVEMMTVTP